MNTREREVMDALAEALRGVHPNPGLSTTLAAYDALLAEGSASSEGAEAVGYLIRWNDPTYRGKTTVSDIPCHPDDGTSMPLYTRPQPAQGEPGLRDAYEGAREDLLDWKGRAQRAEARLRNLGWAGVDASEPPQGETATVDALAQFIREIDGKHELGAGALAEKIVKRFALPQGEHEQRSSEGSERRPIADEVVERTSGGDPAEPRDDSDRFSCREAELLDAAYAKGYAAAVAETNALREAAESVESFVGVWFGDTNGNYPETVHTPLGVPVKLRAIMADLRATLESALPRDRPIADEVVELSNSLEEDAALLRGLIDGGDSDADALDRIADSMERTSAFLKSVPGFDVGWNACRKEVLALNAAIAAQQRQGGGP